MAKNKGKKKNKTSKLKKGPRAGPGDTEAEAAGDAQQPFWSTPDECAHYAALGCHIANIARCNHDGSKSKKSSSRRKAETSSSLTTCSDFEELYQRAMQQYPWLLGIERFDPMEYHPEDIEAIPEVAMNDGEDEDDLQTLTLTNVTKDVTTICFVTIYDVDLCDCNGNIIQSGVSSITSSAVNKANRDGSTGSTTITKERKCTTFIVLCPPQTFVHLCYLAPNQNQLSSKAEGEKNNVTPITSWSQVEIENDIQPWSFHSNVDDEHSYLLHFPFNGLFDNETSERENEVAYQCTQSEHGQLTHFFHGNYHAIDFACPIGTPLYSPANGVVVEVRDRNNGDEGVGKRDGNSDEIIEVSGIAARNLFHWNSIMIRVDETSANATADADRRTPIEAQTDQLFIEFVHIQTKSSAVQVGDVVRKGQLVCRSGSVGFSPEPHLHLAAYRRNGNDAATVRVRFEEITSHDGAGEGSSEKGSGDHSSTPANGKMVPAFLPRAGGWYNQNGLVKKGIE